jgi:hypothetical protein
MEPTPLLPLRRHFQCMTCVFIFPDHDLRARGRHWP